MKENSLSRRSLLKNLGVASAAGVTAGMTAGNVAFAMEGASGLGSPKKYTLKDLDLSTPEKISTIRTKILGSIAKEDTHAFMRFHIYGYMGKNIVPFFSMNNYVLQKWNPTGNGEFQMQHYEVGYYTEFDTDNPITHWKNPVTGEDIELEQFVLGPVPRVYAPEGVQAPGIAPQPLNLNVIGDRIFLPAQTIESFPNMFLPEEWPKLSSGPVIFWDSMYTYSAAIADVVNPAITSAPVEIHMQNLTSWQPFLRLGQTEGRSMARAFGTSISGFDALDPGVRKNFEKFTPEIFETEKWLASRFDVVEYYQKMVKEKASKGGSR